MNKILFAVNSNCLPVVSALDSCSQKPPYVHFKRKYHEFILYVITSGELFLKEDDREYHLKENDCILLDPDRTHVGIKPSAYEFCYFHFRPGYGDDRYKEVGESYEAKKAEILFPKVHSLKDPEIIRTCRELCSKVHDIAFYSGNLKRQKAAALLHLLMLEIYEDSVNAVRDRRDSGPSVTVDELERFINKHYMDKFDSDKLAERFGYNFDHLNRLFKKEYGDTIYHHLLKLRCEEAKRMILTGYYSNDEIAARVGFAGSSHFSHVYKSIMGCSPRSETKK